MKKIYSFTITLLAVCTLLIPSYAQDCGYYQVNQGAVMGYQSMDEKGKLTGSSRITVLDVQSSGSTKAYTVKSEIFDSKNKLTQTGEYGMKCEDGIFTVDMKSFIDPKTMEGFKDMEVSFSGMDMTYPTSLSVGQTLPDANVTMAASSGGMTLMKMTINITNRKVEAVESVTVPAGTYNCYKITYDIETKMGIKISSVAAQWINMGVGNVKTETYDKKGKLLGTTVLSEFKS